MKTTLYKAYEVYSIGQGSTPYSSRVVKDIYWDSQRANALANSHNEHCANPRQHLKVSVINVVPVGKDAWVRIYPSKGLTIIGKAPTHAPEPRNTAELLAEFETVSRRHLVLSQLVRASSLTWKDVVQISKGQAVLMYMDSTGCTAKEAHATVSAFLETLNKELCEQIETNASQTPTNQETSGEDHRATMH